MENLKEYLRYDKEQGKLFWMKTRPRSKVKIDSEVGYNKDGYRRFEFMNKSYYVHRVIWFFHFGYEPAIFLDHIDGNPLNNKIENLREADHEINNKNKKRHRDGFPLGVSYRKDRKKWHAYIKINKKRKHIGYFDTMEQASQACENYYQEPRSL